MDVYIAEKTLAAIDNSIKNDQGGTFRGWLGKVIGHMDDAYSTDEFPFRSHLGASLVGGECARQIWYNFRWSTLTKHPGRLLRLFNRGHLEEARFIAALLSIGVQVYQQDENGKQFRVSDAGGHFGGSGDGVGIGIPDLEALVAALLEFKTSAEKPFVELAGKNWRKYSENLLLPPEKRKNIQFTGKGVRACKFEHYVQMQVYMKKMGLAVALYVVVNKNNDELYAELVPFNAQIADEFIQRGVNLVWMNDEPDKLSNSPAWFACKWCDHRQVCHYNKPPHRNCRTCRHSQPKDDGNWYCESPETATPSGPLTKEEQLNGCQKYERKF